MIFLQLQMDCIITLIFPTQHVLLLHLPKAHHEALLHVWSGIQFGLHHMEIAMIKSEKRATTCQQPVNKASSPDPVHASHIS
jgi:hypothetical protein